MNIHRTQEEILKRIESSKNSIFDYTISDTVEYLSFDNAKKFLKEGTTKEEWDKHEKKTKSPLKYAIDYVKFAWEKANNCRGLSASRSVEHFRSWFWLCGICEFDNIADEEYKCYGKPILVIVSVALGIDWKSYDNGEWVNNEHGKNEYPDKTEIDRLTDIGEQIKLKLYNLKENIKDSMENFTNDHLMEDFSSIIKNIEDKP